jgi:hypothetical protein
LCRPIHVVKIRHEDMISEAENIYVVFGHKLTIAVCLYYSYGLHLI